MKHISNMYDYTKSVELKLVIMDFPVWAYNTRELVRGLRIWNIMNPGVDAPVIDIFDGDFWDFEDYTEELDTINLEIYEYREA